MDADGETMRVRGRLALVCISDFSGRVYARSNPGRRSARGSYDSLGSLVGSHRQRPRPPNGCRILFPADLGRSAPLPGHGWYARNGGSVEFLGDHFFADSKLPRMYLYIGLLSLLLLCLARTVASKNVALFTRRIARGGRLSDIKTLIQHKEIVEVESEEPQRADYKTGARPRRENSFTAVSVSAPRIRLKLAR